MGNRCARGSAGIVGDHAAGRIGGVAIRRLTIRCLRAAIALLGLAQLAACAAAPPIGPAPPHPVSWVAIADRGWHTDLCAPSADASGALAAAAKGFPGARVLCLGFGERDFFLARGADPLDAVAAVFPSRAALLLTALRASPEAAFGARAVVRLPIDAAGRAVLARFLARDFAPGGHGAPRWLRDGPYPGSAFYAARGSYDLFSTCNTWSARGLRAAGVPVGGGVITAGQVMGRARAIARAWRTRTARQAR